MKLLLIDNYDSFTYNIVELLRQLKIDDISIQKNNEVNIEQARQFDKIIISPGPATPSESGNIVDINVNFYFMQENDKIVFLSFGKINKYKLTLI